MKRVLVTGADGFIGRHTISLLLKKGYEVHALSRKNKSTTIDDLRWHQLDLMDEKPVQKLIQDVKPSHLLHLAWYTEHGLFWQSEESLRWVEASLNLLRCFSNSGGKRVAMVGTCAEYDWQHECCVENITPCNPHTLYGICKHALHSIAEAYCKNNDISLAWGRVFFLFGPNEHPKRFVPQLINGLINGQQVDCTEGTQIRDFMHVTDVAGAFVSLVDSDVEGPVNIASGQPVTLRYLAEMIMNQINGKGSVKFGARPMPISEPAVLKADVTRLHKEVGRHAKLTLDLAVKETINWWRENGTANL